MAFQDARFALILGEREVEAGVVQVKDLQESQQSEVSTADGLDALIAALQG